MWASACCFDYLSKRLKEALIDKPRLPQRVATQIPRFPCSPRRFPFITMQTRKSRYLTWSILISVMLLCLLLLTDLIGNWAFLTHPSYAVSFSNKSANMTFQQFLALGHQGRTPGVFLRPQKNPPVPGASHAKLADYGHLPSSIEPATMKLINQPLTTWACLAFPERRKLEIISLVTRRRPDSNT